MLRWTAVLLLCAVFLPLRAADRLDRLEADLDRLEPRFWRAAGMSPDEPYYQETAELLARLESNGRDVQQILSRARLDQMPNLSEPVSRLRNLFRSVSRRQASSYYFRLKGTGMREYEKSFRRGRSRRTGKGRREEVSPPTVDPEEYSRWLSEVCEENMTRFSRRKGERNSGQDDTLRERLAEYCGAIQSLRNALVVLRRNGRELKF